MSVPVSEKGYTNHRVSWWGSLDDEETPELRWPNSIKIYEQMRRQDAQVMSVLRAVTLPIRRTRWSIDPAGARPEVARLIADDLGLPLSGEDGVGVLRTRDRFSWKDHLRLALLMLSFGHSYFEQVYRIIDGRARLRKLGWRPPRTISNIEVASDGGLEAIYQHGQGSKDAKIPVSQLVAYVNDREGGNWRGQSLLRPAFKFWLLKDRALRVQAQTIERNGLGIPDYESAPVPEAIEDTDEIKAWQEAEIEAGLGITTKWRSGDNAGTSRPHGSKLDLKGVSGKLPDAGPVIRYYDEQIAGAVLANFLKLGGQDTTGSYALGETFADFFVMSLQTVAMDIADVTNQHVVEDMVDLNFGEQEPAPRLVFEEIGSRHPATAEAIRALIDCGALRADDDLEAAMRARYGLPQADPATARTPNRTTVQGPADQEVA